MKLGSIRFIVMSPNGDKEIRKIFKKQYACFKKTNIMLMRKLKKKVIDNLLYNEILNSDGSIVGTWSTEIINPVIEDIGSPVFFSN